MQQRIRYGVQAAFLLFMSWMGYQHQLLGGGAAGSPTADALCPFGGLEGLYSWFATGEWLRRLAPSALILFVGLLLATLAAGRVFCSWICPLGTLGEWSAGLARKLGIRPKELPEAIDRPLRGLKYAVLAGIIALTWQTGTLIWREYDPWVAWMHLSAGFAALEESPWAFAVLFGTVLGASLFIERFWCRYLCPLGAVLAPLQMFSATKVRRNDATCVHCAACARTCPVRLDPEKTEAVVSPECLACGRCTDVCPVSETLVFKTGGRRLSTMAVGLLGIALFLGSYGTAKLTGHWVTYAAPAPQAANPAKAVYGWMTFAQVAETVKLPAAKVLEIASLPADTSLDISMKKIEGVDDHAVQEALAAWFATHAAFPTASDEALPPDEIRGSMTGAEVAAMYKLDVKALFRQAGWPDESPADKPLKDVGATLGKEVSDIRDAVKALQTSP